MQLEYLVVLPVDSMLAGTVYAKGEQLPLHCTLMPWFRLSSSFSRERLEYELMILASNLEADCIELICERHDLFGPSSDIPVSLLRREPALLNLHTQLLVSLIKIDSQPKDVAWIGAGYRPHITQYSGDVLITYKYKASCLSLLERGEDGAKKVIHQRAFAEIPF